MERPRSPRAEARAVARPHEFQAGRYASGWRLVRTVNIALNAGGSQTCLAGAGNRDDAVTIDELIEAVKAG
jgi:hypothetical protein